MKLRHFLCLALLFLFHPLHAQNAISEEFSDWHVVLPGEVLTEPVLTSYGFCLISDAQQICAFSNSGTILWKRQVERGRKAFVGALNDDFLAVISGSGRLLSVLNPSGVVIWKNDLDFVVNKKPFSGRDGRFFVTGENSVQCFGINGVSKWKLTTPKQSNLPVLELNDGSLMVFLEETVENKTCGLRISPFGDVLEEITFVSIIEKASSCKNGILLNFTNGTSGLFCVENNQAINKWTVNIQDEKTTPNTRFVVSEDKLSAVCLIPFSNSIKVYRIGTENGEVLSNYIIQNINTSNITKAVLNNFGLFIFDNNHSYFYSNTGELLFTGELQPDGFLINFVIYTNENYMIFCKNNWSIEAYRIINKSEKVTYATGERNYFAFIDINKGHYKQPLMANLDSNIVNNEKTADLVYGNYGLREIKYLQDMISLCEDYENFLKMNIVNQYENESVFNTDSTGINSFLAQLPMYSTIDSVAYTAVFLKVIKNKSHIHSLLNGVGKVGYDPYGEILDSIEQLSTKLLPQDEGVILACCDAVYSICRFMGRPAFNSKGKKILARFISSDFSDRSRKYTYKTMKKISNLDL